MTAKRLLIIILIATNWYSNCGAALRRTPKVYNALITTDENLTSSRAYPVIQPTLHETGLSHYPFGPFNPYGVYTPFIRFGQAIAPGLRAPQQLPYALPQTSFPPQFVPRPLSNEEPQLLFSPQQPATATPTSPAEQLPQEAAVPITSEPVELPPTTTIPPETIPNENVSLPLNEYGLPPALIPLPQYPSQADNPVNLPEYGFKQYPPIYDPLTRFNEQYLPPYQYYSVPSFPVSGTLQQRRAPQPGPLFMSIAAVPNEIKTTEDEPSASIADAFTDTTFQNTKYASQRLNNELSDVSSAQIPSGAKSKQA